MLIIQQFHDLGSPSRDYFGVGPSEEGATEEPEGTGRFAVGK